MLKFGKYFSMLMSTLCLGTTHVQEQLLKKIRENDPPQWMTEQISFDLEPFKDGITLSMLDPIDKTDLAKIIIHDGKVYAKPLLLNVHPLRVRLERFKRELIELSNMIRLPNVIFLVNLSDGYGPGVKTAHPIFVFSKDKQSLHQGILFPDHMTLKASKQMPDEVQAGDQKNPWHAKKAQAFWRGGTTGFYFPSYSQAMNFFCTIEQIQEIPRFKLVKISKEFPDKLDAIFTRINTACSKNEEVVIFLKEQGLLGQSEKIEKHVQYKYQILIDGATSAWLRAFWQFWSNCAVLKQESPHMQWYYRGLMPYIHYLPFARDCSNLIDLITWAQNHDEEMQEIAENGKKFAQENLTYADLGYYIYYLLTQYAQLQRFIPARHHYIDNYVSACFSIN